MFFASISAQIEVVHIDVRIPAALQRAVAPVLDVDIHFLVQLTDSGGRHLAAPQNFGNIVYSTHRNTCQIHLDERFLHVALPAAIPLNNCCLKGNSLEARNAERDVGGGKGLRS